MLDASHCLLPVRDLNSLTGTISFSVNARKVGDSYHFGWALSRSRTLVWTGRGTVPAGLEPPDLTTAYLAGAYSAIFVCRCLSDVGPFTSVCANKTGVRAISKIKQSVQVRRWTLSPHYDWLSAIRSRLGNLHVRSHRSHPDSNTVTTEEMLLQATTQLSLQIATPPEPTDLLPCPSSDATLLVGTKVINNNFRFHLRQAYHLPLFRSYALDKFGWSTTTFDNINWDAISCAYKKRSVNQQLRTTKFMYGWLPVGRLRTRIDPLADDRCPSCFGRNETNIHLLRCTAPQRRTLRTCQLDTLRAFLDEWKTPAPVKRVILIGLARLRLDPRPSLELSLSNGDPLLRKAIESQNAIGWQNFLLGFISSDLHYAATRPLPPAPRIPRAARPRRSSHAAHTVDHPPLAGTAPDSNPLDAAQPKRDKHPLTWGGKLVTLMWNYFEEHWLTRNSDLHGLTPQDTASIKLSRLHLEVDRIYQLHDSLLFEDRQILDKPIDDIKSMSFRSLSAWIHHVNTSINRCLADAAEVPSSQRRITDFFSADTGIT